MPSIPPEARPEVALAPSTTAAPLATLAEHGTRPSQAATTTSNSGRVLSAEGHHSRIISGITVSPEATPPRLLELRKTEEGEEPQLDMVGIGAVLAPREDALVVGQVFPGGGAAEAGLAMGDGIVRVNGRPVVEIGFADAIQSIRGPEGSKLVLGVRKAPAPSTGESPAPVVDITVVRRRIRR